MGSHTFFANVIKYKITNIYCIYDSYLVRHEVLIVARECLIQPEVTPPIECDTIAEPHVRYLMHYYGECVLRV